MSGTGVTSRGPEADAAPRRAVRVVPRFVPATGPPAWREELVRQLEHAGLACVEDVTGSTLVLVAFERMSGDVTSLVRTLAREETPVVAIARNQIALDATACWDLLRAGALDVFGWDNARDPAQHLRARVARWRDVEQLCSSPFRMQHLVGASPAWSRALRTLAEAAAFSDAPVLLLGETGTGKENLALLAHQLDRRAPKGEFVVLDCTTIVPELAGSEFYGHERGAFTGAAGARDGAFSRADGGTLFLDEVGELSPTMQGQLLRVIQEGLFKRVGGDHWHRARFRLVCATHRDLKEAVARGRFREDLYYRLAGVVCRVPPLRERAADILPLARHFIAAASPGTVDPAIDPPVVEHLLARPYPGNVRELRQLVLRVLARHAGPGPITMGDLPVDEDVTSPKAPEEPMETALQRLAEAAVRSGRGLREIMHGVRDSSMRAALLFEGGNAQRAAQRLGVTDRSIQQRRRGWERHGAT